MGKFINANPEVENDNKRKAVEVSEEANNLDINRQKAAEFEDLMQKSSTDVDKYYYDSKNPLVRIILVVLGGIIIFGSFIVIMLWWVS